MRKRKAIRLKVLAGWALLGALALPRATAAQVLSPGTGSQPGQEPARQACASCTVVREIDDPSSGQHWLLMRDPAHAGGPGVLEAEESVLDRRWLEGAIVKLHPVIRAGDRLMVEQSTAKADIQLEGIALSPAAAGELFRVRLQMSGKVVRTVALGPGRAVLATEKELWQ